MSQTAALHVGDIGTALELTVVDKGVVVDLSDATTLEIILASPCGTVTTFEAELSTDGTDGKLRYVTESADDLDEAGTWQRQGHVITPDGEWHTSIAKFTVGANLDD